MIATVLYGLLAGLTAIVLAPSVLESIGSPLRQRLGNIYATISMQAVGRPTIGVSETGVELRRRGRDEEYGKDTISTSNGERKITRISDTIGRWGARSFTFVDEKFGNSFDLRDVVVGYEEHQRREDGEMVWQEIIYQTDEDGNQTITGASTFYRAVLDAGAGVRGVSLDLSQSIHPITDGSADSMAWERTWEAVKRMFADYDNARSALKLALPVIGLFGGAFAGYYLFGPGALPGGSSGGTTIGVGASSTLLGVGGGGEWLQRIKQRLKAVSRRTWIRLAVGLLVGIVAVTALVAAPVQTLAFGAGAFAAVAGITLVSAAIIPGLGVGAEAVGRLWLTLAFKSFSEPTVVQDSMEFKIAEADSVETDADSKHRLCKAWVSFAVDVDDAFGEAGLRGSELGEHRAVTDGGSDSVPSGMRTTEIENASHIGVVPGPEDTHYRHTYVRTDRWLGRFADASTGETVERAQQEATKEFAGGEIGLSDKMIIMSSIATSLVGLGVAFALWGL